MTTLNQKVALITGASKGIGRATALALAREGAHVAAVATSADLLETLKAEIESTGAETLAIPCDVSKRDACEAVIQGVIKQWGRLDILVNNAGIGFSGPIVDSDPGEAERMVQVNILGVYYMTRAVLPTMIAQKSGHIINIGSVAGLKYSPGFALYSATKFAIRAFSEALRNEVQGDNIRVTLLHPGMVETNFYDTFASSGKPIPFDKGKLLQSEHIADAIVHALTQSEAAVLNEIVIRPPWQER